MSGLELPTVTGAAWIVWEPLTTGDLLTRPDYSMAGRVAAWRAMGAARTPAHG